MNDKDNYETLNKKATESINNISIELNEKN